MKSFISTILPVFFATYVSAHGLVTRVQVNGGQMINVNDASSSIRKVSSQDPIKGAMNPAVNCGTNAQPASSNLQVQPGDTIGFDWREANDGLWPHNTGPELTYFASCGATTCDKVDSSTLQWFKTDQKGRDGSGQWVQAALMNGALSTTTVPANLAPGNYMIRHEIIALHLANSPGGAEFYAGCVQAVVGGSGTGAPAAGDLVSLPGAYSDNDPGILVNAFDAGANYQFPGPAISALGGAAAPAPATSPAPAPNTGAPSSAPDTSYGTPGASSPAPGAASPAAPGVPSPAADAPAAPAPTASSGGKHHHDDCEEDNAAPSDYQKRKLLKRKASPLAAPAPIDIVDEIPEPALNSLRGDLASLKPRSHNSRIMRRLAFEGTFH